MNKDSSDINYEWGQSFIGQDVCGSKYNVDPFGQQDLKPDAWAEMKRRIEEIATAKMDEVLVVDNSTATKPRISKARNEDKN